MEQKDYRLAAIMYTDIQGYSRMMEKDEAGTLKLLDFHNTLVSGVVASHNGSIIKTIGDAFLVDFKNTLEALKSAIEIQDELYDYNKDHPDLLLLLRIGIHLGDIYFYENDALGDGINIAARLQSVAHPGCICMSQDVYNQVLNKIDFHATKLGKVSLKNITKEVHAYEIVSRNVEFDKERATSPVITSADAVGTEDDGSTGSAGFVESAGTQAAFPQITEPARPASRPQPETNEQDDDDLRREILAQVKKAGRRLSADEVRLCFAEGTPGLDRVVSRLVGQGILIADRPDRESSGRGERGQSRSTAAGRENSQDRSDGDGFPSPDERRDRSPYGRGYFGLEDEIRARVEEKIARAQARAIRHQAHADRHARRYYENGEDYDRDGKWERKLRNGASRFDSRFENFSQYRDHAVREARKAKSGFTAHFITYASVNAFLIFLNVTVGGRFPWALIPLGGWGIGILEHYFAVVRRLEVAKEAQKLPDLEPEQFGLLRRLNKVKDGFVGHAVSVLSVTGFLGMLNLITGPRFLWFMIPGAALVISLLSHYAGYASRKRDLESKLLDSLNLKGGWSSIFRGRGATSVPGGRPDNEYYDCLLQAEQVRNAILSEVQGSGSGKGSVFDKDMIPVLDKYLEQIKILADRSTEIDRIVRDIPMDALAKDKAELQGKLAGSESDGMKKEYQKSIGEIEKQETSFQELKEQKEVLYLRLKSSVNSLKQMQIDLARVRNLPETAGAEVLVHEKTAQLNEYIEDMRSSYREIESPLDAAFRKLEEDEAAKR
jgi:class 3 adenylate cyclase